MQTRQGATVLAILTPSPQVTRLTCADEVIGDTLQILANTWNYQNNLIKLNSGNKSFKLYQQYKTNHHFNSCVPLLRQGILRQGSLSISQRWPEKRSPHRQMYEVPADSHLPPFIHGKLLQTSAGKTQIGNMCIYIFFIS